MPHWVSPRSHLFLCCPRVRRTGQQSNFSLQETKQWQQVRDVRVVGKGTHERERQHDATSASHLEDTVCCVTYSNYSDESRGLNHT